MAAEILAFLDNNRIITFVILIGLYLIASQIVKAVRDAAASRAFEESRREIAAYVAEGSISADQAASLLAIGRKGKLASAIAACSTSDDDEEECADPDKRLAKAIKDCIIEEDVGRDLVNRRPSLTPHQWAHAVELVVSGMGVDQAIALARVKPGTHRAAPSPIPSPTPANA